MRVRLPVVLLLLSFSLPLAAVHMLARRLQRPTMRRVSAVILAVLGCGLAVGELAAQRGFPCS